jgi:Mce-associated membrane protein
MMSMTSIEVRGEDVAGDPEPADRPDDETGDAERSRTDLEAEAPSNPDGEAVVDDAVQKRNWRAPAVRIVATAVVPGAALLLAVGAGYLKWASATANDIEAARAQSVQAAVDSTVAMLSYRPDTVEANLAAAQDRMTGAFRDSYTSLTKDVVIPGAKQRQISAVATVPAAASVSATPNHAVVLVFVNQTAIVGNDPPSDTASSVKVTLEKVDNRWLISQFDPV